jgi:ribosomal protein L40E
MSDPDPQAAPSSDLLDRRKRAEKIEASPENYKVCEGCESIVGTKATTCPSCHGYRFDESAARVVAQARLLGSRPATTVSWQD